MWKKIGLIVLCIGCFLVAGCGVKEEGSESEVQLDYNENSLVFRIPGNFHSLTLIGMGQNDFYYYFREMVQGEAEECQEELGFYKQALEQGSEPVRLELSVGELLLRNAGIVTDDSGKDSIVLLLGEEKESELQYALYEYDEVGNRLTTVPLQATGIQGDYPEEFRKLEDGSFALISRKYFWATDSTGETVFSIPCPGVEYAGLVKAAGEKIGVTYVESDGKVKLAFVDIEKQSISSGVSISGDGRLLCTGQETVCYVDEKGIHQYFLEDGTQQQILDLTGRNIEAYQIVEFRSGGEGFELLGYSADGRAAKYLVYGHNDGQAIFKGEAPEKYDAYGRQYIYLYDYAGEWPKYSMDPIDAFNEQSDKYQVVIRDYGFDTADITKNIANGELPDLIYSRYNSLMSDFLAEGLLEDLTPYIQVSRNLTMEDLSEPIVKAYTKKGRLFGLPATYQVSALYGPKKYLGEHGWTLEEFLNWLSVHPSPGVMATRTAIMDACLPAILDSCIDWENGRADFDSTTFQNIITNVKELNRVKTFSKEEVLLNMQLYEMDEAALSFTIPGPAAYIYDEQKRETDMVIKGYPDSRGIPVAYLDCGALSILSTSEVKEGAYEFLEFYLLYRAEELNGDGKFWTVNRLQEESLEELLQADNYMGWSCSFSREQIEEVMSILTYTQLRDYSHEAVIELILEELEPFFEGQKSAEDVSEIIQSRVQIYLDEQGNS